MKNLKTIITIVIFCGLLTACNQGSSNASGKQPSGIAANAANSLNVQYDGKQQSFSVVGFNYEKQKAALYLGMGYTNKDGYMMHLDCSTNPFNKEKSGTFNGSSGTCNFFIKIEQNGKGHDGNFEGSIPVTVSVDGENISGTCASATLTNAYDDTKKMPLTNLNFKGKLITLP